jgi:hypothetical protein
LIDVCVFKIRGGSTDDDDDGNFDEEEKIMKDDLETGQVKIDENKSGKMCMDISNQNTQGSRL